VALFADSNLLLADRVTIAGGSGAGTGGAGEAGWMFHLPGVDSYVELTLPADGATGDASGTVLEWAALPASDHFHVEVDDDAHIDASANHPESGAAPVAAVDETPGAPGGPLATTSWVTPPLAPSTTYYWHVVAHDASGAIVGGSRLRQFTTP
jgi:hypothetical protein